MSRQRLLTTILLGTALTIWFLYRPQVTLLGKDDQSPLSGRHEPSPREIAANSTLGFDKILAVSPKTSWRTRGLLMAARLTGLTIDIPEQPYNSDDLIYAFERIDASERQQGIHPGHGSARAWLAHLDIMKYIVASHISSAFVVEDDVDWDIDVHSQMRLVSDNIREFLRTPLTDSSPFGQGWDVLWLGHCGDELAEESVAYADSTILDVEISTGWSKKYLLIEKLPPGHRAVQYTQDVGCTFGYGVTRLGARKILQFLGAGQDEAFDVALMNQCRKGNLQCVTVLPELMHHYTPKQGTGYVSPNDEGNGAGSSAPDEAFEYLKGTTKNVKNSARCWALFDQACLEDVI